LNETLMLRPSKYIPTITSFTPKALKRDKLNKNLDEVFRHITKQTLQNIKSDFEALGGQSASDLVSLNKIACKLIIKREALDAILDQNLYPNICEMLDTIFLDANLDPILIAVRNRIKKLEESKLLIQE